MSIPVRKKRREQWGSQLGFVLSASGAAVGLGNIQRFPYLTASWGGAAFVLAYLLCVVLIVLPMMWAEIALGRQGQTHPVAAFSKIRATRFWKYVGGFSVWTAFLILCYYIVLAGWTLAFSVFALTASYRPLGELTQTPWAVILSTACFQLANVFIVRKGLQKGIERYNKILLPLLFILLCSLAIYSLTLPKIPKLILLFTQNFQKTL
ncbi:MAG: hypothetical protein KA436_05455 [Oligoflexales bacterium]|nr:hypothetical protein [Oligoflexales bacterium]